MATAKILEALSWAELARPLAAAEDALARLDERLAKSPIRDGWRARTHFDDAAASLWLEGQLVPLEDLVLHDAGMDVRRPTHELTRAHAVLRARRRIAAAEPGWALSTSGIEALRGRADGGDLEGKGLRRGNASDAEREDTQEDEEPATSTDDEYAGLFASVDATLARAESVIAGEMGVATERDTLVYDLDWDEDSRLGEWRAVVDETRDLPPTLAAAVAAETWRVLEPLQHAPWLGRLLVASLLRQRGKARSHLPCLNEGLKAIPRRKPHSLTVELAAIAAAAEAGMKRHDRWLTARAVLLRSLDGRRSNSRLPALVDYVMSRPIVSAGMIAKALGVTPRAAQNMVADLGLREATGRGRYRAWGVI